jgi:hypothetical protein
MPVRLRTFVPRSLLRNKICKPLIYKKLCNAVFFLNQRPTGVLALWQNRIYNFLNSDPAN